MNKVGNNLAGSGLWKIILFIIIVNITNHIINQIEKKNQESSINQSGTQAIGASKFQTIGKNHKGFRVFISSLSINHLLNKITANKNWTTTQIIQKYLEISVFICKNQIENIINIFQIPGKKFDFTLWEKSALT